MNGSRRRLGYLVAIVGCSLALLLRLALTEPLADQGRLLPFILAVMAAAWCGGTRPGLFATLLSLFFAVTFVLPRPTTLSLEVADAVNSGVFLVIGTTISFLFEALDTARRQEAEKQFRTLADSMPQLVWMARPDGEQFWFNQRWYEYTGTPPGEPIVVRTFYDPAQLPRVRDVWKKAVAAGAPWEDTFPLRRKDGQMRWHLCRAVPVRDENGEIIRWFGTNTDIQDRIEIEETLRSADARKDEFLAVLAHELRNPLAPISYAVDLWPQVAGDAAELERMRALIERQVRQLIRLIDDLMDVSRITRGKITLHQAPVAVQTLVAGALEAVQPLIDAAGHMLTTIIPPDPIYVSCDSARMTQVFSNLLNNAAKYTPRHGALRLTVERQQDTVVVRVRDNGPGIPADMLEEIFKSFHQVEKTLDRSGGGLGIGLWLARQLVELHGGTIEAHSAGPGEGSEFCAMLPIVAAPDGGPAGPTLRGTAVPHRVLVVDDLKESAETLAMVLEALGQHVTALYDPQQAIDWAVAHQPDVIFLDIAMPGLDGYEVARRLRQHSELDDAVLVALTGYGQPSDQQRAYEAGFSLHLTKPANIAALRGMLNGLPAGGAMSEAR